MIHYQYKCSNCDYSFEKEQSIKDKIFRKCPKCGKKKLQRLIGTGSTILFKGPGFYATDYLQGSAKDEKKVNGKTVKIGKDKKENKKEDKKENKND